MNVIERAQQWVDHDPDPATAAELASAVEAARAGDESALAELNRAMALCNSVLPDCAVKLARANRE